MKRAESYHLPVVIAYETLSSVNYGRYRLLFIYNEPITDIRLMELINRLLLCVFPEADQSTSDLAKMFYPGNNVKFLCENPIYIDTLAVADETAIRRQIADLRESVYSLSEKPQMLFGKDNTKVDLFIKRYDNIRNYNGHLFTTYSKLITMTENLSSDKIVIIDEYITQQCIQVK